jgi:hypothetical protein
MKLKPQVIKKTLLILVVTAILLTFSCGVLLFFSTTRDVDRLMCISFCPPLFCMIHALYQLLKMR